MILLFFLCVAVGATSISLSKSELYAKSGDSANVLCNVVPSSPSSYSTLWYRNGNTINLENVNVFTLPLTDSSTLYFNQIGPSMAGNYECAYGNNTFNQTQITFTLYVDQAIITFPSCLDVVHAVVNMSMTYICFPRITNQLPTAAFWMKDTNGTRLQLHNTSRITVGTDWITFHSSELSDAGTYVLGVFNPLEIKYFSFTVNVHAIPSVEFENATAPVNRLTLINCSSWGRPLPNISLMFNNHTYLESNMTVNSSGYVKNVSLPMNISIPGMYMATCLSHNIAGNTSVAAYFNFGYLPEVPLFPNVSWTNLSTQKLVMELSNMTLLSPYEIVVRIYENVTHYHQYELNHNVFDVVNVEINRTYNISIRIENEYGISPEFFTSFSPLFGVPCRISSISFPSSHLLQWNPPPANGFSIIKYIIYYMGNIEITVNSSHSSYNLGSLMTPGRPYHLAIAAANKVGRSKLTNFTMMIPTTTTTHIPTTLATRATTIFTTTTTRKGYQRVRIVQIGVLVMLIL